LAEQGDEPVDPLIVRAVQMRILTANAYFVQNAYNLRVLRHGNLLAGGVVYTEKDLADMIRQNGTKLKTGFTGTPYLLHALSDNGYADLAYDLLLQKEYPSWLYPITKGATTIWEHWDGIKPDGSFWSADMNSFNHYAYGSVADWLYEVAAGIKIDESKPAFEHVFIKPVVHRHFMRLKASIDTKYGKVSSKWGISANTGKVSYEIEVPNTATVIIGGKTHLLEKGIYNF